MVLICLSIMLTSKDYKVEDLDFWQQTIKNFHILFNWEAFDGQII